MNVFEATSELGHEQVTYFQHAPSRLRCIVAMHSTVLGPALGGLRMWPYASESDALRDALQPVARDDLRAAIAGLNLGGGKAVLIGNPESDKSEALFRALGRFVGGLSERYIATEDVGTTMDDMELIRLETDRVVGVHPVERRQRRSVAVHGARHFPRHSRLSRKALRLDEIGRSATPCKASAASATTWSSCCAQHGAKVFVTDINEERVEPLVDELRAEGVPMHQIYDVDATVFSPCAMGGIINEDTVPRLQVQDRRGRREQPARVERVRHAARARGILYAPDYAINAGGLMNLAAELDGYRESRAGGWRLRWARSSGASSSLQRGKRSPAGRQRTASRRNASARSASRSS